VDMLLNSLIHQVIERILIALSLLANNFVNTDPKNLTRTYIDWPFCVVCWRRYVQLLFLLSEMKKHFLSYNLPEHIFSNHRLNIPAISGGNIIGRLEICEIYMTFCHTI
jgi:hypothetical protein